MSSTQDSSQTSDMFSSLDLGKIKAELESSGKVDCPTPTCSETFKSIWGLKFHLKKNSCNSPKFKCDKCQGAFQSRIVLQQHTCGPSSCKDTHASIFKKDAMGSSVKQDIVSPDINEKNKSAENIPGNQEILSQKIKRRQPTKPETVTAMDPTGKATENSINSDEDCFLSPGIMKPSSQEGNGVTEGNLKAVDTSQMQKPKEIFSDNQDTPTTQRKRGGRPRKIESTTRTEASIEIESEDSNDATSQASGTKENSSNKQEVSNSKRKRRRPQTDKITVTKATIEKECGDYTDEETTNQIKNGNVCSTTKNAAETSVEDLTSPKRKRGRPRKSESPAGKTHEDSTNVEEHVSLRARDEAFAHHLDAEENYRSKDTTEKDGKTDLSVLKDLPASRKRKRTPARAKKNVECVTLEDSSEPKNAATPVKKRGRPRKVTTDGRVGGSVRKNSARSASKRVNYAEKEDDDSDEDSAADDSDDASPSAKKSKLRTSEDRIADDDDDKEDHDDGVDDVNMKTPKLKQTKEKTENEKLIASLKKQLRTGKISCTNKCGKKFASIAGLKFHLEICGKEREIIKCEQCGKEYTTQAGLKYHMSSFHVETEVEAEEKQEEDNQDETEIEETTNDITADTPKRPRRAAARAKQKFQEIEKEQKKVDKTPRQSGYGSRSSALDPHIKKVREGLITPALMEKFKKELKKSGRIVCPNEDCKKKFNIYITFSNHYLQCGFDTSPFECMLCGQEYNSLDGARSHVEKIHEMFGKDGSIQESEASGSEQEISDDDSDSDEEYKQKSDEESNEEDEEEDNEGDLIDDDDRSEDDVEDDDTLNWDKQKRRYKVEMKRKGERGSDVILYVGRWNKTFREFEKWRKKNFSKKESFPKHMPTLDHWSRVKDSDVSDYTPTSTQSPHFRIERPNVAKHKNTSDTQLPVFTGLTKEDGGIHGDRIFYTGGPVWELSWCPTPDGQREENQYLVASAHKSFDAVYNAYECHKNKALLQVWNLGILSNTSSSSGASPTLALGIAHDFGPVWRISWCPNGAWQSPQSNNKGKKLSRLGLMAMACGDGIVRIISVPHPDELLSKLDSSEGVTEESEQRVLVHCEPHLELYPCPLNATYSGRRGQAMCVEWSPLEPYDKVAAGFSDGTVAVWNLLTESPFLRKHNGNRKRTIRLAPFVFIKAHSSLIRDLAFCPAHVDFLVTGGHDRCYRIWDLKSSMSPVFVSKKGFPYEVEWPFYANGFVYCEDVMYFKDEPSVRFCNLAGAKPRNSFFQFPSCVFTFSCNSWINVAASADVAGNVVLSKMISSGKQRWHLYNVKLEDLEANGEASDSTGNTKSHDQQNDADLKVKSRSLKEEVNSSRIVFEDKNSLQFRFLVSKNNKEIEEKLKPLKYNCSSMQAIHKVRWNPNKQALTWIASGGASGLVRIHHVRQVEPHHLKSAS